MDKDTSLKIKNLIADNKLEEALDVLIGIEQSKGRERYNTLILLKGKLEMLEEQELADLLDFDDLAREKGKIAHSILKMTDDTGIPEPNVQPVPIKHVEVQKNVPPVSSSSPIFKYSVFGVLGMVILFFVYKMAFSETPVNPIQEPTEQPTVTHNEQPKEPAKPTQDRQQIPKTDQPKKVVEQPKTQPQKEVEQPKEVAEELSPPPPKQTDVRLSGFPNVGTTFSLGDTKFVFKEARVKRLGNDGKLELACKIAFTCRTNFDTCTRPNILLLVDDNPIAPSAHNRAHDWMDSGATLEEELTFIFDARASNYRIQLEKHNSPWVRGFKILQ